MANGLGMITRGPALSGEHGAFLGRGLGEQTANEREVRNGPPPGGHQGHTTPAGAHRVPGYPQDMMDMHVMYSAEELRKINKPLTRGMRSDWYRGVEALMTVLRVLPDELYEKVVFGNGEVQPGASVPGSSHEGHQTR